MTFLALSIPPSYSKIVVSQDQGLAPTKARDTMPSGPAYVPAGQGAAPVTPAELRGKILRKGSLVLAGLGAFGVLAIAADAIETADADTLDKALDIDFDFSRIPAHAGTRCTRRRARTCRATTPYTTCGPLRRTERP